MAQQDTYVIPEIKWWGLPVGLAFLVFGVAMTFYVNQGIEDTTTAVIGAVAFLIFVAGVVAFGSFVFSIIARGVGKVESKSYIPSSH